MANNHVSIDEQETYIGFMRDESWATICTSDSTQITRFDKLCKAYPDMYQFIGEDGAYKRYKCMDKSMISLRGKKRELSDEQKQAAGERMRKYQHKKNM